MVSAGFLLPVLSLAVALAGPHATVDGQKVCAPSREGIIYDGIVAVTTSASSADACRALCANSDSCVAYNWKPFGGASFCDLLDFRGVIIADPLLPPQWTGGRCSPQLPTVNGDFAGNDVSNQVSTDATQCGYKCEDTHGCHAFSWTNYNGGTCWIKSARAAAVTAPFDGSVVSGEPFKCSVSQWGTDIVGGDLASVPRADWRDCCGVCRRTAGCVASSWSTYNGGTCWLKNTAVGYGTASGVIAMELL